MSQALVPVDVRTVDFYGDAIIGALVQIGDEWRTYVPLRPICTYLGLDWSGQRQRIMRDEVLADEVRFVRITRTNTPGGAPAVLALPLEHSLAGSLAWMQHVCVQRCNPGCNGIGESVIKHWRQLSHLTASCQSAYMAKPACIDTLVLSISLRMAGLTRSGVQEMRRNEEEDKQ